MKSPRPIVAAAVLATAVASCVLGCTSLDREPEARSDADRRDGAATDGGSPSDARASDGPPGDGSMDAAAGDGGAARDALASHDADAGAHRDDASPGDAGCGVTTDEVCNGRDDDCDGRVDEQVSVQRRSVPFAELAPWGCGPSSPLADCMAAARGYCTTTVGGCNRSGVGILADFGSEAVIACLGPAFVEQTATFGELGAAAGMPITPAVARSRDGQRAVHLWCTSLDEGYRAGIGPTLVDDATGTVRAICIHATHGTADGTSTALLGAAGCTWPRDRDGTACSRAADDLCTSFGDEVGLGPIDVAGTPTLICFGDR